MDTQYGKITIWLAVSIVILSTGLISHVMAIPIILDVAGRDSWLSVIFAAPIFVTWLILYVWMIGKLQKQPYLEWISTHWGKYVGLLMKVIIATILFFNATYTLLDTMIWTITTYLPETPFFVLTIVLIILCMMMAYNDLQSIAIITSIMLPLVIFLGYLVALTNMKHKDWSLLLPMFEHGISPAMQGSIFVLATLMDFWIVLLFSHRIKQRSTLWRSSLVALFLLMLVLGPITGALTEFGAEEAMRQRHTAFEQWKIFSLGRFLQHVDFLSIYQWLAGAIARITINWFLLMDLFQFKKKKSKVWFLIITGLIMFFISFRYWRYDVLLDILHDYYFPFMLGFVIFISLSMGITIMIVKRKEKRQHE